MIDHQKYRNQVEGWFSDRETYNEDDWTQFSSIIDFLEENPTRKSAFNDHYARGNIEAEERSDGVYIRWTTKKVDNNDLIEYRKGLKGSRDYVNVNHEKMPLLHIGEAEEHFESHKDEYEIQRFGIDSWEAVLAQWSSKSGHIDHDLYVINDEVKEEDEVRAYVSWMIPEWADKDDLLFSDKSRENYIRRVAEKRFETLTERNIRKSLKDLADAGLKLLDQNQS